MLNELFKHAREMQGKKQSEIAGGAGIGQPSMALYESGRSTLSDATLRKIAPLLSINKEYLNDQTVNPFKSKKLIKMTLPTRFTLQTDFTFIHFLVEVNKKLEFLLLSPNLSFFNRIAKGTVFEVPLYAIVIRDQDGNMFLLRRKEKSVFSAAITGEKGMMLTNDDIAAKKGTRIHYKTKLIDKALYEKIQSWEAEREDFIPLFNQKEDVICSEAEVEVNQLCREKDIDPEVMKHIIKLHSRKLKEISNVYKNTSKMPDLKDYGF